MFDSEKYVIPQSAGWWAVRKVGEVFIPDVGPFTTNYVASSVGQEHGDDYIACVDIFGVQVGVN